MVGFLLRSFPLFDFSVIPTADLHFETQRHTDVKKEWPEDRPHEPLGPRIGAGRPWRGLRGEARPAGCSGRQPCRGLWRCLETVQQCLRALRPSFLKWQPLQLFYFHYIMLIKSAKRTEHMPGPSGVAVKVTRNGPDAAG